MKEEIYIIMAIIVLCGIIGGVGSSLKEMRENGGRFLLRNIMFGILASITVPLFLNLVSSDILKIILDPKKKDEVDDLNYFIFAGFCIVAAYSSIQYLNIISSRVVQNLKEDYAALKVESKKMKEEVERINDVQKTTLVYDETIELNKLEKSAIIKDDETQEVMKEIYNPEKKFTPVEKILNNVTSIENEKIEKKIEELKGKNILKEIQFGDGTRAVALSEGVEDFMVNGK
ncbi:YEATS-associated helix-containing protein [Chryseobacterium tongliaoense]|uniref:YEATS-associated helix-containing protein n=1 Tax=Chryseobacterium tongliaoense TaxID=3240933 RepID=UPI003513C6C9